jgi:hypothetical protein
MSSVYQMPGIGADSPKMRKIEPAAALFNSARAAAVTGLQLDLFGDGERIVHFDAKVTDRAFELRVPEE